MKRETENITTRALKALSKEYVAVGKTRVRSWHACLISGVIDDVRILRFQIISFSYN